MLDAHALQTLGWRGGDGNASYLDKTLRHGGMEVSLDDRVTARDIATLFLYAVAASLLSYLPFLFLGLLVLIAGGGGLGLALMGIGAVVSFAVFWVVFLCAKLPEPISEWRVLLDARTDQAESVYSKIAGTLGARSIPLGIRRRRIRTGIGTGQVSNRLVLSDGAYVAYVSVFGYGSSLYLGWMMWRSRRGIALIKQYLSDLLLGVTGRADTELLMLRTERPRAMREAVHAACREGLVVAIDQTPVPLSYGFPQGLPPVENGGAWSRGAAGPDLPSAAFPSQGYPQGYPDQEQGAATRDPSPSHRRETPPQPYQPPAADGPQPL